jgi:glycosyltransferase involved in cell wall biosynthesis
MSSAQSPKVSVIMPVERIGGDAERAIASVLNQQAPFAFELIVVSAAALLMPLDDRLRNVVEHERNPATRRNRAASVATGELLAFIDDDAIAPPSWLATAAAWLDEHPEVLALGGPDPAPPDSSVAELISDTLLATPLIGSGIACHESRPGIFDVKSPSDIALVNLFVRRDSFEAVGGFDEAIGYIGEDTRLLEVLRQRGRVIYHGGVRVFHRRRAFPEAYLRQRWRYRVKTGELLIRGGRAYRRPKVFAFLLAPIVLLAMMLISPLLGMFCLAIYAVLTFGLGAAVTRLPWFWRPLIPLFFAAHHATYFAGIVWGVVRALVHRGTGTSATART